MAFAVVCPSCSCRLALADDAAGTVVRCPKCNEQMGVPGSKSTTAQVPPTPMPAADSSAAIMSAWKGLPTPMKAAVIGSAGMLLLSCFLCGGAVGYMAQSGGGRKTAADYQPSYANQTLADQPPRRGSGRVMTGSQIINEQAQLAFESGQPDQQSPHPPYVPPKASSDWYLELTVFIVFALLAAGLSVVAVIALRVGKKRWHNPEQQPADHPPIAMPVNQV
jgi:hypothetical protein